MLQKLAIKWGFGTRRIWYWAGALKLYHPSIIVNIQADQWKCFESNNPQSFKGKRQINFPGFSYSFSQSLLSLLYPVSSTTTLTWFIFLFNCLFCLWGPRGCLPQRIQPFFFWYSFCPFYMFSGCIFTIVEKKISQNSFPFS